MVNTFFKLWDVNKVCNTALIEPHIQISITTLLNCNYNDWIAVYIQKCISITYIIEDFINKIGVVCCTNFQIDLVWFKIILIGPVPALLYAVHSLQYVIILLLFNIHVVDTLSEISTMLSGNMWELIGPMVRRLVVYAVETMGLAFAILLLIVTSLLFLMFFSRFKKATPVLYWSGI